MANIDKWDEVIINMMTKEERAAYERREATKAPSAITLTDLGRQLYAARLQRKLTQTELGEKAGMSQEEIARLESGKANPSYKTLSKVIGALEYEVVLVQRESRKS